MKIETEILEVDIVKDDSIQSMTLERRKARGFCTCPLKTAAGIETAPDPEPCRVHPKHLIDCAEYNQSRGLVFFDDRRNRHVTWEDAVEAMRQPRYAGATSRGLLLYTWTNLIRLLEALSYPARQPATEITEEWAEHLIELTGQDFPPDGLASLMVFARGGETEALCKMFRANALKASAAARPNEREFASARRGAAKDSTAV